MRLKIFIVMLLAGLFVLPVNAWPPFAATELQVLRQGKVLSEGGHEKRVVWARMAGVVKASPMVVWELFIDSDAWPRYGIPRLIDSRLVSRELAAAMKTEKKVDDFYASLGTQQVSLKGQRRVGGKWTHFAFQHYDVPWPVKNRWMIVDTEDDETASGEGRYLAVLRLAGGNLKEMEGEFRLSRFQGDPRRTLLEYSVRTDPGAHVPRFLVKWGVKKIMPAVIQAIRREAKKRATARRDPSSSGN